MLYDPTLVSLYTYLY